MDTMVVTGLGKEGIMRMSPPKARSKTVDLKKKKRWGLNNTLMQQSKMTSHLWNYFLKQ